MQSVEIQRQASRGLLSRSEGRIKMCGKTSRRCLVVGIGAGIVLTILGFFGIWKLTGHDAFSDNGEHETALYQHYLYNIGQGQKSLQDCYGKLLKQSFPDIDYALFGYNILRGYPLARRSDPGFTLPIFKADYNIPRFTADCRYSLPHGLTIVPDVSCVTSFSSQVVQNSFEFSTSLETSANVKGGGWGVSFSASAEYKKTSSQISSGQSLYILSMAKCLYFFSKLHPINPPPLTEDFVEQARKLSKTDEIEVYMEFFENYGTHYPLQMAFGAKYINMHKMTESAFKTASSESFSVSAQASYSGIINIGGGFSLGSEEREAASRFSRNVETTTVSIGAAPPSDGDANTWASTVKDSPIPMEYTLESIDELFKTDKYFRKIPNVDTDRIYRNVQKYKSEYCMRLYNNGEVDSCAELTPGIKLAQVEIDAGSFLTRTADISLSTCIHLCLQDDSCVAVEHSSSISQCDTYRHPSNSQNISFKFGISTDKTGYVTYIFPSKIRVSGYDLHFGDTEITAQISPRADSSYGEERHCNIQACRKACFTDSVCFSFTFCGTCAENKCKLYSERSITIYEDVPIETDNEDATTVFISRTDERKNRETPARC